MRPALNGIELEEREWWKHLGRATLEGSNNPCSPTASYFMCGVQRSGTSLLCELLRSTGMAGRPHEFFWRTNVEIGWRTWAVSDYAEYVAQCITAGTTPNGLFGAKVMWNYFDEFSENLRALPGRENLADVALLASVFPSPRFIWIYRDDVVSQAVSWAKALQTDEWYVGDARKRAEEPVFDFGEIHALAGQIRDHNLRWKQWFAANAIEPFTVRYEDLVRSPVERTRQILRFPGVALPEGAEIRGSLEKQSDGVSNEWVSRYAEALRARNPH